VFLNINKKSFRFNIRKFHKDITLFETPIINSEDEDIYSDNLPFCVFLTEFICTVP